MAEALQPLDLERLPDWLIVVRKRLLRRNALTLYQRVGNAYVKHLSCKVAIGADGYATPTGTFMILRKESPPTYTAPKSAWAQAAGYVANEKLAVDDPKNPLRGAFLWINDQGVGIHGTNSLWSLGTRASHGCIRVSEEDALTLYRLADLGTPVVII